MSGGERNDLTRVRGVCDYFLISGERRIEYDFSSSDAILRNMANGLTFKY